MWAKTTFSSANLGNAKIEGLENLLDHEFIVNVSNLLPYRTLLNIEPDIRYEDLQHLFEERVLIRWHDAVEEKQHPCVPQVLPERPQPWCVDTRVWPANVDELREPNFDESTRKAEEEKSGVAEQDRRCPSSPAVSSVVCCRMRQPGKTEHAKRRERFADQASVTRAEDCFRQSQSIAELGSGANAMPECAPKGPDRSSIANIAPEGRPLVWRVETEEGDEDDGHSSVGGGQEEVAAAHPLENDQNPQKRGSIYADIDVCGWVEVFWPEPKDVEGKDVTGNP
jgi:hypothetical protein